MPATGAAYEQVAYPGYAYEQTHPAHLQAIARLFGLTPPPAVTARVLELGCGDGANALAIAQTLPRARVTATDLAAGPLAGGRALAGAAGLDNIELRAADLLDAGQMDTLGRTDYVIAHGVYSWIPPAARGALLEHCRRFLAPHGVAFISFNAYPGSYLRDMARDVLAYHLRDVITPADRLASARRLMEAIVSIETPSPYASVLREHLARMQGFSDALLFHDDLAEISTPFYFHEFMAHANAHGLQFLSEARLSDSQILDVPAAVGELIDELPDDVVVREQYLDFFRNRMFRQTLLVHAEAPITRAIDDTLVEGLEISSPVRRDGSRFVTDEGGELSTNDPVINAAMDELSQRWPGSLSLPELLALTARRLGRPAIAGDDVARLRSALLQAYAAGAVRLLGCALPATGNGGVRPTASPLARAQIAAGRSAITTLLPSNHAATDERERSLIGQLDGTRDTAAVAAALGLDAADAAAAIARLAREGLLMA